LLKKTSLRKWLSSLFLVHDISSGRLDAPGRKSNVIAMRPVAYRTRKTKLQMAERSCEEPVLRSL